ncbi:MAG: hypothetical protein HUK21_04570 [Fibrobacteraceae bacterium]|nr:hypothetical protein [Fibrobacteraceae bacterium]
MKQFVLAFPLSVSKEETLVFNDVVKIDASTEKLFVPGCGVEFNVKRLDAAEGVGELFQQNGEISSDELLGLNNHKSLLFFIGNVSGAEDVRQVNGAIAKVLNLIANDTSIALGVYMQQSGSAWVKRSFMEFLEDDSSPMDPWINFIQIKNTVYTLGLETFGLPDLCMDVGSVFPEGDDNEVELCRDVLNATADYLYEDGIPAKSGTVVDDEMGHKYELRQELKSPFAKDDPEYNKQGMFRLLKK